MEAWGGTREATRRALRSPTGATFSHPPAAPSRRGFWARTSWPIQRRRKEERGGRTSRSVGVGCALTRKARNSAGNPNVAVHLESGDDTGILEGTAEVLTDPDPGLAGRPFAASKAKYGMGSRDVEGIHAVRPRVAFAWSGAFPHVHPVGVRPVANAILPPLWCGPRKGAGRGHRVHPTSAARIIPGVPVWAGWCSCYHTDARRRGGSNLASLGSRRSYSAAHGYPGTLLVVLGSMLVMGS